MNESNASGSVESGIAQRPRAALSSLPLCALLVAASFPLAAEEVPASEPAGQVEESAAAKGATAKTQAGGAKALSGMSILGNQEAPKALVIVPWKSSQLGDSLGLSNNLDDARRPVDKDVFLRELQYYEIRSN